MTAPSQFPQRAAPRSSDRLAKIGEAVVQTRSTVSPPCRSRVPSHDNSGVGHHRGDAVRPRRRRKNSNSGRDTARQAVHRRWRCGAARSACRRQPPFLAKHGNEVGGDIAVRRWHQGGYRRTAGALGRRQPLSRPPPALVLISISFGHPRRHGSRSRGKRRAPAHGVPMQAPSRAPFLASPAGNNTSSTAATDRPCAADADDRRKRPDPKEMRPSGEHLACPRQGSPAAPWSNGNTGAVAVQHRSRRAAVAEQQDHRVAQPALPPRRNRSLRTTHASASSAAGCARRAAVGLGNETRVRSSARRGRFRRG